MNTAIQDDDWKDSVLDEYFAALDEIPDHELRPWIVAHSTPANRAELAFDLLHGRVEKADWDLSPLHGCLPVLREYLTGVFSCDRLLHRISVDAMYENASITWADLSTFGFSANEVRACIVGDPFALGEVLLDRYRIEQRVGSGRFGVVYRAVDIKTGLDVAVKSVLKGDINPEVCVSLLAEEARLLSILSVDGIPRIHGWWPDERIPFLIMDFAPGQNLRSILVNMKEQAFDLQRGLLIVQRIAEIVHDSHKQKLIHRDLKPDNILLTDSDEPYVVDFGIALAESVQFVGNEPRRTGSLGYMAPEALLGLGRQLDSRTDVYSLGAILYELVTGIRAIDDTSKEESLVSSLFAVGRDALMFPEDIPESVQTIIRKCLHHEPFQRFDSAEDLKEAIQQVLSDCEMPRAENQFRLLAWRSGIKLGSALECLTIYYFHVKELEKLWNATRDAALCKAAFQNAMPHVQFTLIHYQDMQTITQELDLSTRPFPHAEDYSKLFYGARKGATPEQIEFVIEQKFLIGTVLEGTFTTLQAVFHRSDAAAGATFELACRIVLAQKGNDDIGELSVLVGSALLPSEYFNAFFQALNLKCDAKTLHPMLLQLDREIERYLQQN